MRRINIAIIKDLYSSLKGKSVEICVDISAAGMMHGTQHKGKVVDVIVNVDMGYFIELDNGEIINTRYIVLLKVSE